MRRIAVFVAVVSLLLLTWPASAQEEQEPGTLARVFVVQPKMGMVQQFEEAYAQHVAWHQEKGDDWTWLTWQIQSGENFGKYAIITPGHHWADFDNRVVSGEEDAAHYLATVGQYTQSVTSHFWRALPEISRPLDGEEPAPVRSILFLEIRRGKTDEFMNAVKKVHQAIGETDWPTNYIWVTLVNGGSHPMFALVLPRENWAGFAPQEEPFDEMLEEAYGEQEAEEILRVIDKTIKSEYSHLETYRPDLSYIPAGQ